MRSHRRMFFATLALAALSLNARVVVAQHRYFAIRTVDASGRPLAGVRLRTTNEIERVSDRNGVAAFYEPGLMGRDVWFTVERAGYEHAAIFGLTGRRVTVTEGASVTFTLTRTIRRTRGWENVPVVIMTSRGDDADKRAGLDAGADAYLLKSEVDQAVLVDAVRRLVGR